jgi:hypothetical protein
MSVQIQEKVFAVAPAPQLTARDIQGLGRRNESVR